MIIYVDDILYSAPQRRWTHRIFGLIIPQISGLQVTTTPEKNVNSHQIDKFPGFTVQAGGYTVDNSRCKIVQEYWRPKTLSRFSDFWE